MSPGTQRANQMKNVRWVLFVIAHNHPRRMDKWINELRDILTNSSRAEDTTFSFPIAGQGTAQGGIWFRLSHIILVTNEAVRHFLLSIQANQFVTHQALAIITRYMIFMTKKQIKSILIKIKKKLNFILLSRQFKSRNVTKLAKKEMTRSILS